MSMHVVFLVFKRNHRCIGRFLKHHKATGSIKRRPGGGWKRKTTERQDRYIERQVLKRRRITSGNWFSFATGLHMH